MKKLISIASIGVFAFTALLLVRCEEMAGGAPTNVKLEAATDVTVKITWSAPTEGTPDKYVVSFMETGTSSYTELGDVTTTEYTHDPDGKTGTYKVTAKFGSDEYDAATTPTTKPVYSSVMAVSELNAAGDAGYGWNTDGTAATYSMTVAGNAASVDLYITDWATGYTGEYSIASPDMAEDDDGNVGVVPQGAWRVNGFTAGLTDPNAPLPPHSTSTYFNFQEIVTQPFLTGCYTQDGYYALVKVVSYNVGSGTAQVESWFQLVEGLRLIQH